MAELALAGQIAVAFSGLPAREGPLTVGQRNVQQWLGKPGTAAIGVNRWAFVLPEGATLDRVRAAFAVLLARHEALRTTLHLDGPPHLDRTQRQRVAGEGQLAIDVYNGGEELDEAALTARLEARLRTLPFDLERELPLRIALVVAGATVRHAVAVYTHMALDVGGMALVGRHFTDLVTDPDATPVVGGGWQPVDRAVWEESPAGQRQLRASLRYWERQLRTVPHSTYAVPRPGRAARGTGPVRGAGTARAGSSAAALAGSSAAALADSSAAARRSPAFELKSPAAAIAVPHIAARTGTSPTTVVVTAFVAVLAHRTRQRRCAFVTLVGNRMGAHLHGYVGTLAGPSLVVVDTAVGGFDELARRTGLASLAAARHAVVDVGALNELSLQVQRERGVVSARDVVVNNIHRALGQSAQMPSVPLSGLAAAAGQTTSKWTEWERVPQLLNFRMFRLDETGLTFRLGTASVTWVSPDDLECMARGVEALLLAAAPADVDLNELTGVTGVEPVVHGSGWRYLDGSWVELADARRLVADALAPATTAVFVQTSADGEEELVAYLAGGGIDHPAQAHQRCVDALPGPPGLEYYVYTTIAPRRYVLCAAAPADVDDLGAWQREAVRAEGTGRIEALTPAVVATGRL